MAESNQKEQVSIMVYPFEENKAAVEMLNYQYREKLIVQLIAGDIDLICLDETQLDWLLEQDLVTNLSERIEQTEFDSEHYVLDPESKNIVGIRLNKTKDRQVIHVIIMKLY